MGYQLTSDYTEVDQYGRITLQTTNVAYTLYCSEESYVYRNFGANYFNNIDVYFRIKIIGALYGNGAQVAHIAFKNTVSCIKSGGGLALVVRSYRVASGSVQIHLTSYNGSSADANQGSSGYVTLGAYYYCRLVRSAGSTTATLYIYTDSARTILWTTLNITHSNVATQYQYLYWVSSIYTGYGYAINGETGNITIPTEISGQLPGWSVFSAIAKRTLKCLGGLAGLSTFSAVLKRQLNASGSLPAIGALGASIQVIMGMSGSVDGLTDLYSILKSYQLAGGQIAGESLLAAACNMTAICSGELAGLGALAAVAKSQMIVTGSLPAIGDLGASIQQIMKVSGHIDGLTDFYSIIKLFKLASGEIAGESLLSATGNMTAICSGELAGLGELSAEANTQMRASGTLPAIGALDSSAQIRMKVSGSIDGLTDLSSSLRLINLINVQIAGESLLSAISNMTAICSAELVGLGILSAEARSQMKTSGSMPAIGSLDAVAQTLMKASGSIDGRTGIWVYRAGDDIFLCKVIILKCDVRGNYRMSAILTDVQYVPFKQLRVQPWAASYIIPPDVNADAHRS